MINDELFEVTVCDLKDIVVGKEAPEVCPVCNHPRDHFQLKAENY